MAGTSDRTEGQVALITSELLFSVGGYVDSLEGIDISSVPDGAVCYVRDVDADYRWLSLSVAAPALPNVILPTQLTVGDPGRWVVISSGGGGGTPGAPVNSVQFNDGGAFGGSAQNLFFEAAAGTGPRQILQSSSTGDADSGWLIKDSSGVTKAAFSYTEDPVPANESSLLSGGGALLQVDAFEGDLELKANQDLLLTRGAVTWTWPTADGTSGQVLTTDGAGGLSFTTAASAPTIQNITVAGPTNITNTSFTVALVNFAGAATVVLPTPTSGKRATVKDISGNAGTNNITVGAVSGNVDGAATKTIATNFGSMSFVADGTNWWIV